MATIRSPAIHALLLLTWAYSGTAAADGGLNVLGELLWLVLAVYGSLALCLASLIAFAFVRTSRGILIASIAPVFTLLCWLTFVGDRFFGWHTVVHPIIAAALLVVAIVKWSNRVQAP